jgi:DNA repair and recombination protein RAD52
MSFRSNGGANQVHYLSADKAISLANQIFGFNGWSSSIQNIQVDYVDELSSGRVNLGLSVIVRITLRDGTYHEDVGYGSMENAKSKGQAFEKAKKEGTTDAVKRALRNFGNALGLCFYDKEFVKTAKKIKAEPAKFDAGNLYRASGYGQKPEEPKKSHPPKPEPGNALPTCKELSHSNT